MTLERIERGVTEAGEEVWILPRGTPVLAGLDRLFNWITTSDESPQTVVVAENPSRAPRPKRADSPTVQPCMARESYLRVSEVAARLGLCQEAVRRLIRGRALGAVKLGSKHWRVSETSLARFLGVEVGQGQAKEPAAPVVQDNVRAARARFRKLREQGRRA